jgi:ubiquinone/menaquinone biosynthesis C-methylase UbiE
LSSIPLAIFNDILVFVGSVPTHQATSADHKKGVTMSQLFWSGKLTLPMRLLVTVNNILALFTGSLRDYAGMKDRVKKGYEAKYSDHVAQYDELGFHLQDRSARFQLEGLQFQGMRVLDVGCGTDALAKVAMENGATSVICGDISSLMLQEAQKKEPPKGIDHTFCQLDAESLPYKDDSFDAVISGMSFGLFPKQDQAVAEMVRIVKPGGLVCLGAHGPEHYWEAIDATFRAINKRYILGYRLEWWPRSERYIRKLLEAAGLSGIQSKRIIWRNEFENGAAAYDFFAAISASFWYVKFPPEERIKDSLRTRAYFDRKNVSIVTDDVVVAYGYK